MYDDPCPNCGHRRKRTVMSTPKHAASFKEMWFGEGNAELWQTWMFRIGIAVLLVLAVIGAIAL